MRKSLSSAFLDWINIAERGGFHPSKEDSKGQQKTRKMAKTRLKEKKKRKRLSSFTDAKVALGVYSWFIKTTREEVQ